MLYQLNEDGTTTRINAEDLKDNFNRFIARKEIGEYLVSTVFLGIDHNYNRTGDPILFETMIFGPNYSDVYTDRCCTLKEAKEMHKRAIVWVKLNKYCKS